jgi:hypothetical protein
MGKHDLLLALLSVALVASPSTAAEMEQYLCVADQSTGFKWEGNRWVSQSFNVQNDRFVFQEVPERKGLVSSDDVNFIVKRLGSADELFQCSRFVSKTFKGNRVVCGGLGYGMVMDTKSLRYQEFYGMGFIEGTDQPGNTPNITIGKCTRLQ